MGSYTYFVRKFLQVGQIMSEKLIITGLLIVVLIFTMMFIGFSDDDQMIGMAKVIVGAMSVTE